MPWYGWLILVLAIGSILGGLLALKGSAKKLPLTDDQLDRIKARNEKIEAEEAKER
ncbi:DUF2897 family protein [Pseudomonas matsuisoli]|uniref:DUF2897 domain-containing protein n=1 Tax=Pseudomonas matsuisoli TaxID=1515666 RepID=A0A917UWQ9_9PSED|nr:DUF2897 family protein [Pseudomonas matsuisoli]GGJ90467.1 DUF2897 domain-containing protein [Pseudomonas matsuisoli]